MGKVVEKGQECFFMILSKLSTSTSNRPLSSVSSCSSSSTSLLSSASLSPSLSDFNSHTKCRHRVPFICDDRDFVMWQLPLIQQFFNQLSYMYYYVRRWHSFDTYSNNMLIMILVLNKACCHSKIHQTCSETMHIHVHVCIISTQGHSMCLRKEALFICLSVVRTLPSPLASL